MAEESILTPELLAACEEVARRYGVAAAIHPDDFIFRFIQGHPQLGDAAVEHYFAIGNESATRLKGLLTEHPGKTFATLLEFAAGYGCVTRHLSKLLPETSITASDIHAAANAFNAHEFGVGVVGSSPLPEQFDLPRQFSAVFALSFFSHMPVQVWQRWLKALCEK